MTEYEFDKMDILQGIQFHAYNEIDNLLNELSVDTLKEEIGEEFTDDDIKEYLEGPYQSLEKVTSKVKTFITYILNKCDGLSEDELKLTFAYLNLLLNGKPIYTLSGKESEWVDISDDESVQKELIGSVATLKFRDFEFNIKIESLQRNIRCFSMCRFNNDNRYAHILDALQFTTEDGNYEIRPGSTRFITFPWQYTDPVVIPSEEELKEDQNKYVETVSQYLPGYPLPKFAMDEYEEELRKPHHLQDKDEEKKDSEE